MRAIMEIQAKTIKIVDVNKLEIRVIFFLRNTRL